MININKDDKKYLVLIALGLVFTIFTTIIFIYSKRKSSEEKAILRLSSEYTKEQTLLEKMSDAAEENTIHNDSKLDVKSESAITKLFLDIDNIINKKDFDKLLSYYNKQYVEEFNITKEQLKDKFYFKDEITSKLNIKHERYMKDRVIVTVRMLNKDNQERIFDFTVFNDGTIADLPLKKEIELNRSMERDGVVYSVNKKYITRLGSIYIVDIQNNSEYLVDIKEINGYQGTTKYNHELIGGNIYTYQITPGKIKRLVIRIDNQEKIDNLELINKKYDGTLDTFNILSKK